MKIVVDIPEEDYKETKMQIWMTGGMIETLGGRLKCAVANGTPLPKGHGRLIDIDAMIGNLKYQSSQVWRLDAVKPEDYYIAKDAKYMETVWKNWCESFYKYAETRPVIVAADKEGKE